jgi:hypothetical protein
LNTGSRDGNVRKTATEKIKCMYTLVRQLYFGSCEVIKAARNWENPPSTYTEVLGHLSTMPGWIQLLKKSACRAGAMRSLALAKAYYPSLDPAKLASGFPEYNADGTAFDRKAYGRVVKQTRVVATQIANALKLNSIQYGYNEANKEIVEDEPQRINLLQSYKDFLATEQNVSSSSAAPSSTTPTVPPPSRAAVEDDEEGYFQSLQLVTWRTNEAPKTREAETEPAKEDSASAKDDTPATTPSTNPAPEAGS